MFLKVGEHVRLEEMRHRPPDWRPGLRLVCAENHVDDIILNNEVAA